MYESYWHLDVKPFENTPDPHFMYSSTQHEEALMRMFYSVRERKQLGLFAGEYGSGKTLLSRVLLKKLILDETYRVILIQNPVMTPVEFLSEMLFQMEEEAVGDSRPKLVRQVESAFRKKISEGKDVVLIIDEAQILKEEEFEQLRLLLNFQLDDRFLFTLLLLGQSELIHKVDRIEPLRQRVAMRYHLEAMSKKETCNYIAHRLSVAGRLEPIYSEEATDLICQVSGGIPRRINNICDHALLMGYSQRSPTIGIKIVEEVGRDLNEKLPIIDQGPAGEFTPEPELVEDDD